MTEPERGGGAPLPAPRRGFPRGDRKPLLDGYVSTELGNVALAVGDQPVGCGRPLPRVEVRIIGADGTPVPDGVVR
ncbi:hypothetical protein AB0J83_48185 [Actinoplanes sp. NPDC049596]|uniref:hypothetical protein n=1 Tax=unclassified Actinoplanes TaxID=2626549 RepID=UPI0034498BB0